MSKALEAKSESSRTKEDIDNYNKAVKEINAAVNNYNQSIANNNKARNEMLMNWSNTETAFENTHMPYYKG